MAAVPENSPRKTSLSSSLLFSTTFLYLALRASATTLDCNYDQQFHVKREEYGDVFTNPCQNVEPNNQRYCHDNCSAKEANFVGKFTFDGGVEQCACKCRQNTHVFDVNRQVCDNTELHVSAGNNQTCQVTVGDALYQTLDIPLGQSSVFLQPRRALRISGNPLTQAQSCQVTDEFYQDRTAMWPLDYIFSSSSASGPFFKLSARSDGYMYIKWMGPAHLSPCLDGLVVELDISCNSSPLTCVRFKVDGTAMYDYQLGLPPCLLGSDYTGSGMGPMSITHPAMILTSPVILPQTDTLTPSAPPASNSNLAMIIGVAVGVVLALIVIGVSVAFLFYRAGKVAGRQRSTMRTNLPASARRKSGVANPAYSSQAGRKGSSVPPPVPPRPGEEPNYYSSADPEDIYMELDGTQQRSLYRKGTSQGGAYTSLNAGLPGEKDKGDASKGPEPPAPPPVGSIPGYEGVYVEPQAGKADTAADTDYEGYMTPTSEGNEYIDLNGGSSNL
ncbi:Hypp2682 [Branchiostoma lanceolatum]|uniref:Hypp2682 protein n=1 Tax=Branchiostoma lanceolatum TaxID=7740 RepID=A0A8J9ZYA7_BRALA|nr:Hypp2682 [Branchiostoma lanceolatum]